MMEQEIERFVKRLAHLPASTQTFNMYAGSSKRVQLCRANLQLYLKQMISIEPKIMLLGEAPGYKGCRLTGVPFTSEKTLLTHPFFAGQNFQVVTPTQRPETEISSTVVWRNITSLKPLPLLWNIYPFHPFKEGESQSNRAPNAAELEKGKEILLELVGLFKIEHIVAVGKKAYHKVSDLDIKHSYVRHPANGGAKEFGDSLVGLN